jgi:hypothetical protein
VREEWIVTDISEDDFGCEERPKGYEPLVIVTAKDSSGREFSIKQADAWLYQQEINVGDTVFLKDGRMYRFS